MTELKRRRKFRKRKESPVSYVTVVFSGRGRQYTFKTIMYLQPDMRVVVRTAQGLTLGTVFKVNVKPFDTSIKYNWIIAEIEMKKLETEHFDELKRLGIKE